MHSWVKILMQYIKLDYDKNITIIIYEQDRRWNADKPSATLDP